MTRKLASIRQVNNITKIQNADMIECVTIDGWNCVTKVGEFKVGDLCVYFEIDSILPSSDKRYEFLSKSFKDYNNNEGAIINGHKLRTIKLKGQVSQGLALPITIFNELNKCKLGDDVSKLLNVTKYELPILNSRSSKGTGKVSSFPSFIKKTDQDRVQNIYSKLDHEELFEVTQKLDGQSATYFYNKDDVGLCSRNLRLDTPIKFKKKVSLWDKIKLIFINKQNVQTDLNSNWHLIDGKFKILETLSLYKKDIAIQGEIIGEGIQANYEKIKGLDFYIFNIYDINKGIYYTPSQTIDIINELNILLNNEYKLKYVPRLNDSITLNTLKLNNLSSLLEFAEGTSLLNKEQKVREGLVFKSTSRDFSFKVISNKYLLNEK